MKVTLKYFEISAETAGKKRENSGLKPWDLSYKLYPHL